jgi:long-chain acyl-CoA synthetase
MITNLASRLKEHAHSRGDAIAIVHGELRVSYKELWETTKSIIGYLLENGIDRGDRVAVLLPNSYEYIASYYAIIALGAVAVPLNTQAKQRDLTNWIKHAGAKWLIADADNSELSAILDSYTGKALLNRKGKRLAGRIKWNTIEQLVKRPATDNVEIDECVEESHVATIIYTSGTTGQPKGVTISHENLVCNTESIIRYLKLSDNDSIVNVLPFYYSYGNSILQTHIYVGGTLILANNMMYPRLVLQLIEKEAVTGFSGVPSTYALLLNRTRLGEFDLSSLRYMTQAGGAMPPSNIERLINIIPDVKFFVMYGQTEATARLSYLPPERLKDKMGSVGIAIPGVELEIRGKEGNRLEEGQVGEIYARGENIMLGYWEDKKRSKEVLRDGWLKTGDLAYYDKDGYLYIVGRSSEMIKTGANRVSPTDIEEVIVAMDGIEEVAVIGIPDDILGQAIKVFVTREKNSSVRKTEIMAFCKNNLANYKLPKVIDFVDKIPRTASGKIQRYLLGSIGDKK